jgi:hypothetical protein
MLNQMSAKNLRMYVGFPKSRHKRKQLQYIMSRKGIKPKAALMQQAHKTNQNSLQRGRHFENKHAAVLLLFYFKNDVFFLWK